jgi:hypothetical protein
MAEEKTKKELEDEGIKWKSLYKGIARTNERFQIQINDLSRRLATAETNLVNAQNAVDLNKNMLHQVSTENNKKEQELIALMNKLKAKLREMGYDGSFDSLGN